MGRQEKAILGLGRRKVTLSSTGKIIFSEPEPFGGIPLSYRVAYGGRDTVAEAKLGNFVQDALGKAVDPEEIDLSEASPFLYPRNPAGRGYLMQANRPAVEALKLPYLEDPLDPLTPDRLVVGRPALWPLMPVPAGTDWLSWGWFPRSAYAGAVRPAERPTAPIMEERRGWALPDLLGPFKPDLKRIARCVQGAALGLSVPLLRGGEGILLEHLHPRLEKFTVRLPGERPVLMTDGRKGKTNSTEPVIHTVVLYPDENTLTIVWRGCARALREYFVEELPKMPLLARWPN